MALQTWQPSQEGGYTIADSLSSRVNPSDKLAATFSQCYQAGPYASDFLGEVNPGAALALCKSCKPFSTR
ncbi:hypothetical protein [Hymenobacter ginkgonis]|uniref:hypothetical protein n=1 Tax=Hymenobacter ginkgonis TaxID=2682976 RepID=UPI0018DDA742|nr:hypothetical protein [Hymenobacter ginkgonis]